MPVLIHILLDLFLLSQRDRTAVSEGSSKGMQIAGVAMFGFGGLFLFFALVVMYLP